METDSTFRMLEKPFLTRCPIGCGSMLVSSDIVTEEGLLLKCAECGQLISQCSEERYLSSMEGFDIPKGTSPQGKSIVRSLRLYQKRLKKIERIYGRHPRDIRLLDVGCSIGSFLAFAQEREYIVTGVEPAAMAVKTAIGQGLNVKHGFLQDLNLPGNYYDAITLFEVIEHLKEPLGLLRECRRILKPGGIMVISTGNTSSWTVKFMKQRWDYFDIRHGGHISFFNPMSFSKISKKAGFDVIRLETRRVSIYRKDEVSKFKFKTAKIIEGLLNPFAKLFSRGHDIWVFIKKPYVNAK
jgi:SAM-dependent methyltransferase